MYVQLIKDIFSGFPGFVFMVSGIHCHDILDKILYVFSAFQVPEFKQGLFQQAILTSEAPDPLVQMIRPGYLKGPFEKAPWLPGNS